MAVSVTLKTIGIRKFILKLILVNKILYRVLRIFREKDLNAHMKEWLVFRDRIPACFAASLLNARLVKNEECFLDIGANYGLFFQQDKNFEGVNIIAFEPNAAICGYSAKNFKWENYAVSDEDGYSNFYIDKNHTGSSSLLSNDNHQIRFNVRTISVDSYLSQANRVARIIKIDVEGSELAVLKGAGNTIKKHKPIFFIETNYTHLPEIVEILSSYHFYKISVLGLDYSDNSVARFFSVLRSLIKPNVKLVEIRSLKEKKYGYIDNIIAIPEDFNIKNKYELKI
jgi:FkbM family methyltransferase